MLTLTLAAFSGGLLWAILGIGFLIFIHEYGHYTACRLTRTRVETFSIGFGPRLFGWERPKGGKRRFTWGKRRLLPEDHAMDFRVAVIPLGGYVKMAGENPGQERSGAGDEFSSKSIAQRLLIVVAGVIMNSITAFVFYTVAIQGGLPKEPAQVGSVTEGSAAWHAGLRTGDRVLELDGHTLPGFQDLRMEAAFLPRGEERTMLVERDGSQQTLRVKARYDTELGVVQLGVRPAQTLTLGEGAGALTVGPRERVEVAGTPALGGTETEERIGAALQTGRTEVEVRNAAGRTAIVRVLPLAADEKAPEAKTWKIGIAPYGPARVDFARGAGAALVNGDALLAALVGDRRTELLAADAWARLQFDTDRVDALLVERAGREVRLDLVGVTTRHAVAQLVHDVAFQKPGSVVAPLSAGQTHVDQGYAWRYPTVPSEGKIQPGERILQINGKDVATFEDVRVILKALGNADPVKVRVAGLDAKERDVTITPVTLEVAGRVPLGKANYKEPLASDGLLDSVSLGAGRFWREVRNTFATIGAFFSGNINFSKNIAGPITLVTVSQKASEESFLDLLWWLAYVSVMLAVLNILPVPVLDGGHLIYLAAEKIRGRPLSEDTMAKMQWIGLILLLVLMFFAVKNDILLNFFS